ncbi:LeuA family protein [Desulfurivibrio dismutans]|uniref:LeuA family protein n=1 Tax=Desulfurivibrio dismutans TaxID=1398908 RepID=UPI0023DC6E70|nr:pyruvate carboxyltransferase [Desulfurivibrio alkaliphilus]MDF1614100.1 hypothetical protein [Desulfurivibrio alkaliphilus]
MPGLIDSTLREGLQGVRVELSPAQQLVVATGLVKLGIEELEVGPVGLTQAAGGEPVDPLALLIPRLRREAEVRRLAVWCRCVPADIERSLALAPDVLSLSIPVSPLQMASKLGQPATAVLNLVEAALTRARGLVPCLALGLEDATRAEPDFLRQMVELAVSHGVDRLRLADTVGIAAPGEIAELVERVRGYVAAGRAARGRPAGCATGKPISIGVHTHNDFGLASANAIAALEAGADWADVSLLGLGERAGLARLEEVAAYLALRRDHPYRLERLPEMARQLAGFCGREIPPWRPVVGRDVFSCETGLHLAAMQVDPASYEPFAPELVGRRRTLLYGIKAGRRAIARQWERCRRAHCPAEQSAPATTAEGPKNSTIPVALMIRVRQAARDLRRPLTCDELQQVFLNYA